MNDYRALAFRPRLLKLSDVIDRTSLSRTKILELLAEGNFPKPCKVATRNCWSDAEISEWIEQRLAART